MSTVGRMGNMVHDDALLDALLAGENFWPTEPQSIADTGLTDTFLEALILRWYLAYGSATGRTVATGLGLPVGVIEPLLSRMRTQQVLVHRGAGPLNDYLYALTDEGRRRAVASQQECAYVGPAPVPLSDYVISVDAQTVADEPILRDKLEDAFLGISLAPGLLDMLGPAVNSGSGLFLYGAPGNGKSTLAKRLTSCFGQEVWIPYAVADGNEVIQLYDPAYHHEVKRVGAAERVGAHDRRWLRITRPTVIVGGELTIEALDIRFDGASACSEAPLHMKSNCGCLLIDDFGRQRISPEELLNRWIIPLENRHDFLTLRTGKKIQVPFEQLIIFSTNLDPADLVDEAFLRRIPYRIEVTDPSEKEFFELFELAAERIGCDYNEAAVRHLLDKYYRPQGRPLRRCHARDILLQIRNYCTFNCSAIELRADLIDQVAPSFFTQVRTKESIYTDRGTSKSS